MLAIALNVRRQLTHGKNGLRAEKLAAQAVTRSSPLVHFNNFGFRSKLCSLSEPCPTRIEKGMALVLQMVEATKPILIQALGGAYFKALLDTPKSLLETSMQTSAHPKQVSCGKVDWESCEDR